MQIEETKQLVIDDKFKIQENFYIESQNQGDFKLLSANNQYYRYLLAEHKKIQQILYLRLPYYKDSVQVAQLKISKDINLETINYNITNIVGEEIIVKNIQSLPMGEESSEEFRQNFYFLKNKQNLNSKDKILSSLQLNKMYKQIIVDFAEIFQTFANYGLFPDVHPNLSSLIIYMDHGNPQFIYLPTYYCQSRKMAQQNCRNLSQILETLTEYRNFSYETSTSIFFNQLSWVLNNTSIEEGIFKEESIDKNIDEDISQLNQILKSIKDNNIYKPQNNPSQVFLGQLTPILNIEQYYQLLNKQISISSVSASDIKIYPIAKKTRMNIIQETLLLNAIFSQNLQKFRVGLKKMLQFESFYVKKSIVDNLLNNIEYKCYHEEIKKKAEYYRQEYEQQKRNFPEHQNLRTLLAEFFKLLDEELKKCINPGPGESPSLQLLGVKTSFLSQFKCDQNISDGYQYFLSPIRNLIYPMEATCIQQIINTEIQNNRWQYIQQFISKSRLTLKQTIKQDDQKNQVMMYEVTVQNPGINGQKIYLIHSVEFLEAKNCLVIKSQIPDMNFNIETGDDIIFIMNLMSKFNDILNTHINEQRKLILQSTICIGNPIEIIQQIIEGFDQHIIMSQILVEFYKQFIETGRQAKEFKYLQLMNEIMHYINQYKDVSRELWQLFREKNDESYLY